MEIILECDDWQSLLYNMMIPTDYFQKLEHHLRDT